jgi:predicted DNA-binding transcriptional regulator AlpA
MAGPIIRLKDLMSHTGLSRSAIYDRMDKNSPRYSENFPKSFSLGGGAVGWFKLEVDTWLEACSANAKLDMAPKKKPFPIKDVRPTRQAPLPTAPPESARPSVKTRPEGTPTFKRANAPFSAHPKSGPRNLAETIVQGGQVNDRLLHFLHLKTWTPAMGALLIAGIDAPHDCNSIPDGGIGLDQQLLDASNSRFVAAHRIFREWHDWQEDVGVQSSEIEPVRFLNWCLRDEIDTEWLRLFLELIGFSDEKSVDLTASRFALLTGRQT